MRLRRRPRCRTAIIWSIVAGGSVPTDWHAYLGDVGPAAASGRPRRRRLTPLSGR